MWLWHTRSYSPYFGVHDQGSEARDQNRWHLLSAILVFWRMQISYQPFIRKHSCLDNLYHWKLAWTGRLSSFCHVSNIITIDEKVCHIVTRGNAASLCNDVSNKHITHLLYFCHSGTIWSRLTLQECEKLSSRSFALAGPLGLKLEVLFKLFCQVSNIIAPDENIVAL